MSWRHDLAARLPEEGDPDRSGPPGSSDLRTDILDELEDHLQCAMDREAIGTTDPDVARRRVLDRFGNPATVARRLWLDAMKEQLMNQRFAIGINLLVGTVVVVMAIVMIVTARNGQAFQAELLERVEKLASSVTSSGTPAAVAAVTADPMQWGSLEVRVVDEHGDPVEGANVELSGHMYQQHQPQGRSTMSIVTDDDGRVMFPPVLPGNYVLQTTLPHGLSRMDGLVIALGAPTVREVRAPAVRDPDPQPVRFRLNVPTALDGVAGFAAVELGLLPTAPSAEGWSGSTISLAVRHDGKVARLPGSPPLLDHQTVPVGVDIGALEWSDSIDIDRNSMIESVRESMLWLAVDSTRPHLVYHAQTRDPRRGVNRPAVRLDEMPSDDGDGLVSLRVSDVVLNHHLAPNEVIVQISDTRTSRVTVPSLEWAE